MQTTYTVVAGKYDDGEENFKYISEPYQDLEDALIDFNARISFPFARIEMHVVLMSN